MLPPFYGLKIIIDDNATQRAELRQWRFPRSRRKRIRRKWSKNPRNYRVELIELGPLMVGGLVVVSSRHFLQLQKHALRRIAAKQIETENGWRD